MKILICIKDCDSLYLKNSKAIKNQEYSHACNRNDGQVLLYNNNIPKVYLGVYNMDNFITKSEYIRKNRIKNIKKFLNN